MKWKTTLWCAGLVLTFVVLLVVFGYLDEELDDMRRWFGCTLIIAGMAIVIPAAVRLVRDWPKMKPAHNVDLAFVQIALGIGVLWIACAMGGRMQAFMGKFNQPMPKANPEAQPTGG